MSRIKQLIEDVAEDVKTVIENDKMSFDNAVVDVLLRRNIITSDRDVDNISLWSSNIRNFI